MSYKLIMSALDSKHNEAKKRLPHICGEGLQTRLSASDSLSHGAEVECQSQNRPDLLKSLLDGNADQCDQSHRDSVSELEMEESTSVTRSTSRGPLQGWCKARCTEQEGLDAWLVFLRVALLNFLTGLSNSVFGMMYVEYTWHFHESKATIGWIMSISMAVACFTGGLKPPTSNECKC